MPAFKREQSAASSKFIHQLQNALANFEQLLSCLFDHRFREEVFRRYGFEAGLGLVKVIQRAFETSDGE